MAVNGIVNGTEYLLYIGASTVLFGTAASFSVETDTKDISARETHNWKKILPTTRKWSMEFEGKLAYRLVDGSTPIGTTFDEIITEFYTGQNKNYIQMKPTNMLNAKIWSGYVFLSSASIEAPNEDNSTFNLSFTGTNELIQS
tara:strand:+ start:10634 stop:11062 length:429 start_codon:yes stop_codon:yes gene_type:complete